MFYIFYGFQLAQCFELYIDSENMNYSPTQKKKTHLFDVPAMIIDEACTVAEESSSLATTPLAGAEETAADGAVAASVATPYQRSNITEHRGAHRHHLLVLT